MSKYNYINDSEVREVMEEYKDKVDEKKANPLDVSSYKVEKPWGYEIWLEVNEYYTYKVIHMTAGNRCSLQWHDKKIETNYIIEGTVEVLLETDGVVETKRYSKGEGWSVPIKTKHRVTAITDYTAVECSTSHLNDCIRFQDDTQRSNGKINSEHGA